MTQSYEQLVAAFIELMERGEKDQRKLAEIAFFVSEAAEYGDNSLGQFAKDVKRTERTIQMYVTTYKYMKANRDSDLTFADAMVLSNLSEDRAIALQLLAEATGKPIGTLKAATEDINTVRDFIAKNPELMTEALKDDDTRSAIATQAFDASRAQVVAEAEGITIEAAGGKTTTTEVDRRGHKAVRIAQFKHAVTSAARGNGILWDRWQDEFDALEEWMSVDEMAEIYSELGLMYDRIAELRTHVDAARKARV